MDDSIVFARLRQYALPWRIRLNLCFLRPTRVHKQMANRSVQPFLHSSRQYCWACPGMSFPLISAPMHGGSGLHLIHASLGPSASITQMAARSVQSFQQSSCQSVDQHVGVCPSPQNCPFPRGSVPPCNMWFLGSAQFSISNGISIGSAVFALLMAEGLYTLQWAPLSKNCPFPW